jgi:hypothetical protein
MEPLEHNNSGKIYLLDVRNTFKNRQEASIDCVDDRILIVLIYGVGCGYPTLEASA